MQLDVSHKARLDVPNPQKLLSAPRKELNTPSASQNQVKHLMASPRNLPF